MTIFHEEFKKVWGNQLNEEGAGARGKSRAQGQAPTHKTYKGYNIDKDYTGNRSIKYKGKKLFFGMGPAGFPTLKSAKSFIDNWEDRLEELREMEISSPKEADEKGLKYWFWNTGRF